QAMAFDSARGVAVLFGGYPAGAGTWEWDGVQGLWSPRVTTISPPSRSRHAMAYDSARRKTVLFGGWTFDPTAEDYYPGDTWEYSVSEGACTSSAQCNSGYCTDGVCCAVASCGVCQSCNGAAPGICSTVTEAPDVDSCAGICDANGVCLILKPNGAVCAAPSE